MEDRQLAWDGEAWPSEPAHDLASTAPHRVTVLAQSADVDLAGESLAIRRGSLLLP